MFFELTFQRRNISSSDWTGRKHSFIHRTSGLVFEVFASFNRKSVKFGNIFINNKKRQRSICSQIKTEALRLKRLIEQWQIFDEVKKIYSYLMISQFRAKTNFTFKNGDESERRTKTERHGWLKLNSTHVRRMTSTSGLTFDHQRRIYLSESSKTFLTKNPLINFKAKDILPHDISLSK